MGINVFSSRLDPKGYNYCIVHIVKVIIFGTLDILFLQFELSKSPPSKEPLFAKNKQETNIVDISRGKSVARCNTLP